MSRSKQVQLERAARQINSDLTAVKQVTDNITVTAAVNLDSVKSDVAALPIGLNGFEGRITDLEEPSIVSKTASYSLTTDDYYCLVDSTSGDVTITLPSSPDDGERFAMKLIEDTNTAILATADSATIDGAETKTLSVLYDVIRVVAFGGNWNVI